MPTMTPQAVADAILDAYRVQRNLIADSSMADSEPIVLRLGRIEIAVGLGDVRMLDRVNRERRAKVVKASIVSEQLRRSVRRRK